MRRKTHFVGCQGGLRDDCKIEAPPIEGDRRRDGSGSGVSASDPNRWRIGHLLL
jgi:hypothetical protein